MIDVHTHFFSRTFFETLAKASPLPGTPEEKLKELSARAGLELPDPDPSRHLARWLEMTERHGVDRFVAFASVPEEASVLAAVHGEASGRIAVFSVIDPTAPGAADRARQWLIDGPFSGLLFFPAMHRFDPSDEAVRPVLEVADRARAVVVVHCGLLQVKLRDLLGLPRAYDLTLADPLRLSPAADLHPNVTFVVPHFGGGFFRETLLIGKQCPNVCVDTSSSNAWREAQWPKPTLAQVFERTLEVFGSERILFGTDSSTLPRGYRSDVLEEQRRALDAIGASDEVKERIFEGNARRIVFERQGA